MIEKLQNSTAVLGISKNYPTQSSNYAEMHLEKIVHIDQSKEEMNNILQISSSIHVKNEKIATTIKGGNQEGRNSTGLKMMVEGGYIGEVQYIQDDINQAVSSFKVDIPFVNPIILGDEFHIDSKYKVRSYIEDVYVQKIESRKMYISVLIGLDVVKL